MTTLTLRRAAAALTIYLSASFLLHAAEVPFQPTRHPNVKTRHVPQPVNEAALRAAAGKAKNNMREVAGMSPKAGRMFLADETHLVPSTVQVGTNGICQIGCGHAGHAQRATNGIPPRH